ncbi:MAG: hypothetical protein AB9842_07805 [Bacteroidales bacterium]
MEKEKLYEIANRANIIHKETSLNEVVIYEDHRTILNVLFFLKEKRNLKEPLDIIMFDYHDDFVDLGSSVKRKLTYFNRNPSAQKLNQIVEFELRGLDDDWVKAGMELGLIGNVFLFNAEDSSLGFRNEYRTRKHGTKILYNIGNVWAALGYHGILNDPFKKEYDQFRKDFGWELKDGKYSFISDRRKFVFDIDLDCFSTSILDKTIAIPHKLLSDKLCIYSHSSYHYYPNAQNFMKDLIKYSELATICFENGCCGGIIQSYKIFYSIDEILFDHELGE